jgi:hypothetical protein
MLGLRATGSALYQVGSRFALALGANLTAVALSLPLVVIIIVCALLLGSLSIVPLGMTVFIGILPNPSCTGLQLVARELAYNESPEFHDQWRGLREHWRPALRVWSVSTVITVVGILNEGFYASQAVSHAGSLNGLAGPLALIWGLALLFWLGMHLYVAPLLFAQDDAGVLLTYRNAAVMAISRPLATWTAVLIWFALLVFTTTTALATVIGFILAAALQQNAFRYVVRTL